LAGVALAMASSLSARPSWCSPPPPPAAPGVYNPAAYGMPVPGGPIEHHNAFINHVNTAMPRAAVFSPIEPTMLVPTAQELALARNSPDGKPPIDALFPSQQPNPWNDHSRTIAESVWIIVNVAKRVKAAKMIPKCLSHKFLKGLKPYQRAFKINTIAMVIKGEM